MLKIEDLWVSIAGKEILKGVNLHIPVGEVHLRMRVQRRLACGLDGR